jgi:hypothetical protein
MSVEWLYQPLAEIGARGEMDALTMRVNVARNRTRAGSRIGLQPGTAAAWQRKARPRSGKRAWCRSTC